MSVDGTVGEHIGTQIVSSDLVAGGKLNRGPPLGIEKNLVSQPVRDSLLGHGFLSVRPHSICQCALAASDFDSLLQRDNVVMLHGRPKYTSILVGVNKNRCFSGDKEACIVLQMTTNIKKSKPRLAVAPSRKRKKPPETGPDGRTLPQRVFWLMERGQVGQTQLARMCSEYYATFVPGATDKVQQQHIFNLIKGQDSSFVVPLIAAVFDVNDMWLQFGIGPMERKNNKSQSIVM